MRASEMIQKLNEIIAMHGDCEVVSSSDETFDYVEHAEDDVIVIE